MLTYRTLSPIWLSLALLQIFGCASTEKPVPVISDSIPLSAIQRAAAATALKLQGLPYRYGGESPQQGFDCSGLVYYVYRQQGIHLPRTAQSLAQTLPSVLPERRTPGDLVFFNINSKPFSHVGIYVGANQFVHAPSTKTGQVIVSKLHDPYWRQHFAGIRRPQTYYSQFDKALDQQCVRG